MQRLDQFLAHTTDLSRALAKTALRHKKVTVNGVITKDASLKISQDDVVTLEGQILCAPTIHYFALNKPMGYVCSHEDDGHLSVFRLIDITNPYALHVAGRLDQDTTGLVLLTEDGVWSHSITHPKRLYKKTYLVHCADPITENDIVALEQGVMLHGEANPTKPAKVEMIDSKVILLTISEGKYHQVRRMLASIGNKVIELHRTSIGAIQLDDLPLGEYRELTLEEIHSVVAQ